jgi:hypothetical protein
MKNVRGTSIYLMVVFAISAVVFLQSCQTKAPDSSRTVTLSNAKNQVTNFKTFKARNQDPNLQNLTYYNSESFTKADLEAILSEKGCDGIRVYHAINDSGRSVMLIVGRQGNTNDLLPDTSAANALKADLSNGSNYIISSEVPCPQMCPVNGL